MWDNVRQEVGPRGEKTTLSDTNGRATNGTTTNGAHHAGHSPRRSVPNSTVLAKRASIPQNAADVRRLASKVGGGMTPRGGKPRASGIRQKEYADHYGIRQRDVRTLVEHGELTTDSNDRIAASELSRTKESLIDILSGYKLFTLSTGGVYLGITGAELKRLVAQKGIKADGSVTGKRGNVMSLYSRKTLDMLASSREFKEVQARTRAAARSEEGPEADERIRSEKARIEAGIRVGVRQRSQAPISSTVFVGPTNSGKSYRAIERLIADYERDPDGLYVYAGPLRMLAHEVYEKIGSRIGMDEVGYLTGEEQINPDANVVCCTVEMAPMEGDSLVLDETHWMVDPDRGQYWTSLLVGGGYDRFYVISAEEALPTCEEMLVDSESLDVVRCERLTPLEHRGMVLPRDVPSRSAVVAFSRKSVYSVASLVATQSGLHVGVLYGALPMEVRDRQIQRFIRGEYDVMVTTDVIGHGINLPIDNVVFAETRKFDGEQRRMLHLWEAAQIAGRAGRYGMTDCGGVYRLGGQEWLTHDDALVARATDAAAGRIRTDLSIDKALVTPQLSDLGIDAPDDMAYALDAWSQAADRLLEDRSISAAPMSDRRKLLSAIAGFSNAPLYPWQRKGFHAWRMTVENLWRLSGAPLDPDGDALYHIVMWICDDDPKTSEELVGFYDRIRDKVDLAESMCAGDDSMLLMESAYASLEQLRMINSTFGHLGALSFDDVVSLRKQVIEDMAEDVDKVVGETRFGRCEVCGAPCDPKLRYCESCYQKRHGWDSL